MSMIAIRAAKAATVAAIALFATLVAFGNLTDYNTNFVFVEHVMSMDTIFPFSTIKYRAITSPALWHAAYALIIAMEAGTALLCWIGAAALARRLRADAAAFNRAKAFSVAGLTLGFLLWQVGFMSIAGEWFGMWQSQQWNGVPSAFRFVITIIAVLIFVALPDHDFDRAEAASHVHLQRGDESLLRDFYFAELAHALLSCLLLLQELALARHIAAVAFGGDVLAQRTHRLARDNLAADRGLDRHLEHVRGDELLELFHHGASAALRARAMHEHGECVDRLAVDEDLHFHQIGQPEVGEVIVERGVAFRHGLKTVVEVEHHLVERQVVFHHRAVADVGQLDLHAAPVLAELEHAAEIFVRSHDSGADPRLFGLLDPHRIRHIDGIVDLELGPVGQRDLIDHRGCGRDQLEVELAREPLLDDLQVQQPEESAAEAEAERSRRLHLVGEARVIEPQLAHGSA